MMTSQGESSSVAVWLLFPQVVFGKLTITSISLFFLTKPVVTPVYEAQQLYYDCPTDIVLAQVPTCHDHW